MKLAVSGYLQGGISKGCNSTINAGDSRLIWWVKFASRQYSFAN